MSKIVPTQPIIPNGWTASTNLNNSIRTYSDLAHRVKLRLGYPTIDINVSDEAIANSINEAIDVYTRYAGYDKEYVIFCDKALTNGCEVQLDDLVDSCYTDSCGNTLSSESSLVQTTYISATNVSSIFLGSSRALVDFNTTMSSNDTTFVNIAPENIDVSDFDLLFDANDPWDFCIKDANRVCVTPLSTSMPQINLTPNIDIWVKVSNGVGEIYPKDWENKDHCLPLSAWWGVSELSLSSFDINDIEDATHVNITGVPSKTVGGLQTLVLNTGRGSTFRVGDKSLDTCGYIEARVQFVNNFDLPTNLSGCHNVIENKGFKLKLESYPDMAQNTPKPVNVSAMFYNTLSSFEYGVSATSCVGFYDDDIKTERKVLDVFFADNSGNQYGDLLFNFEFAFMQEHLGYDGLGNRMNNRGYDLVTYDLSRQFLETIDKYFGGGLVGFSFNKRSQKLRIHKNQRSYNGNNCYLMGLYIERPIEQILPEQWVVDYVTALTKIIAGNTLTKFSGVETLGGLSINGNDILSQGLEEKERLLEWIRIDNSEGGLDKPIYIY